MAVTPSPKPLQIAIVGGGIGGAVLGVAITKYPHVTFTIYESRSAFGANSHRAMSLLNPAIWEGYKSRNSSNGWEEKQNIWFDFTVVEADAVVCCDGIRSACRQLVYLKGLATPVFTNKVTYQGLVPMKLAEAALSTEKANNRQMYLGHGGHFLTFPVENGALMNVVAFRTHDGMWQGEWVRPLKKDELQNDFYGWGRDITKIIELIQAPDVWAIFDHPPVPPFHKGRLCLLGDVAHATSPYYGQGAGMALENVYVLSNLLRKYIATGDIEKTFDAYDFVRVPRALRVTAMSREQGKVLDMEGDGVGDDLEKLVEKLNTQVC